MNVPSYCSQIKLSLRSFVAVKPPPKTGIQAQLRYPLVPELCCVLPCAATWKLFERSTSRVHLRLYAKSRRQLTEIAGVHPSYLHTPSELPCSVWPAVRVGILSPCNTLAQGRSADSEPPPGDHLKQ
jgi:hypothetical protein